LRKAQLINLINTHQTTTNNIMDSPIPNITVTPITPTPYLQRAFNSVTQSVKSGINKFADWIMSYVPEPIKQSVNLKIRKLKERINYLYDKFNEFNFDDELYRTDNASLVGNFI